MAGFFQLRCSPLHALFVCFIAYVVGVSAQAGSMSVSFPNLNSDSIFACDAGVFQGKQESVCRFSGTKTKCDSNAMGKSPSDLGIEPKDVLDLKTGKCLTSETEKNHLCVCTGPASMSYLGNSVRFKLQDEPDSSSLIPLAQGVTVVGQLSRNASSATQTPLQYQQASFSNHIEELNFDFGTELYGAQYFVDFCYVGPKPDVKKKPKCEPHKPCNSDEPEIPNFGTSAQITVANSGQNSPENKLSYLQLGGIKASWDVACSFYDIEALRSGNSNDGGLCLGSACVDPKALGVSDSGSRILPSDKNSDGTPLYIAAPSAESGWVGNLQGAWSKRSAPGQEIASWSSDLTAIIGSVSDLQPVGNLNRNPGPPKVCKLRLYFMEQSNSNERSWQSANSRFSFNWDMAP